MIEVNLIKEKKPFKLPLILGIDFNDLNFKMLIIALILMKVPDWFIVDSWKEEIESINNRIGKYRSELIGLKNKAKTYGQVREQLSAYNNQLKKIQKRGAQVDKILKEKANPVKLLESVTRLMPKDLWFDSIRVTNARKILIKGKSTSYKSIGDFILVANESSFFGKTMTVSSASTKELDERRLEIFEISGQVITFDPWGQ